MDETSGSRVPMDAHALASLEGKHVLITGAGGYIGRHLCLMICAKVRKITLVSISESALFKVENLLRNASCEVVGVLADFGDAHTMKRVLAGVDTVIHAGAHKHVPICERNPLAAISNNVWGTQKLMSQAHIAGVKQFLQISTDKAVEPTSIMGATKRVCELMGLRRDWHGMNVMVVRFGNVLGSDGSVIPLWREQIENGGPLTITDRRCTRYFMTVDDACQLILAVLHMNKPGMYVFKMDEPYRMEDLAMRMIGDQQIEIEEIGLRPGEKIEEELYHGGQLEPTMHPKVLRVIELGERQPSHQYIPDLIEHVRMGRAKDAIEVLWKIIKQAFKE